MSIGHWRSVYRSVLICAGAFLVVSCGEDSDARKQKPGKQKKSASGLTDTERKDRQLLDSQVVEALKKAGSDLSKPHNVEHHFIVPSKEKGAALVKWAKEKGLKATAVTEAEYKGKKYLWVDIIKSVAPTLENAHKDSCMMVTAAKRFGCDYDGWGCTVVK